MQIWVKIKTRFVRQNDLYSIFNNFNFKESTLKNLDENDVYEQKDFTVSCTARSSQYNQDAKIFLKDLTPPSLLLT